eukprot:2922807-Amphidinium_carterae.1
MPRVGRRGVSRAAGGGTAPNVREMTLAAVKLDADELRNAPVELRSDREIVLAAVSQEGTQQF